MPPVPFRNADESAVAEWAGGAEAFYGRDPTTSADGRTVSAHASVPTGEVDQFRAVFPGPSIDTGGETPTAPQVSFAVDYEATGDGVGLLTVTHDGGEAVPADQLRVDGDGFADVSGADQTRAGDWQGRASGPDGAVVAGDSVVVGVESDYEVDLVWFPTGPDGEVAVLLEDSGPDA